MTTWFVSRHPGARDWIEDQGLIIDQVVEHLDLDLITKGDRVIGSLPVNLAARVFEIGAEYWHLSLHLRPDQRGRELSAEELKMNGASLERYEVRLLEALV